MKGAVMKTSALFEVQTAGPSCICSMQGLAPASCTPRLLRSSRLWVIGLLAGLAAAPFVAAQTGQAAYGASGTQAGHAATAGAAHAAGARTPAARAARAAQAAPPPAAMSAGTRFLEACNAAARSGQYLPGCTPPNMPGRELEQLKQEALRTRNPRLMTLVGESYQKQRAGMGDISQAYRWYVMGAVRGDPQAMTRLSEMYRRGQGTAPDRVRALGYAQLAQRVAPDSAAGKQAAQTVRALRKSMASHELAQADRFAEELAQQMSRGAPGHEAPGPWGLPPMSGPAPALGGQSLPGVPHMPPPMGAAGLEAGVAGSAADGSGARRAGKSSKTDRGTAATAATQAATGAAPHAAQAGGPWGAVGGLGQQVPGYVAPAVGAGVLPGQGAAALLPLTPGAAASGKRSGAGTGAGAGAKAGGQAAPSTPSAPTASVPVGPVELRPVAPPAAPAAPVEPVGEAAAP